MDSRVTSPHFPIYSAPLLSSRSSSIINGAILSSVQGSTLSIFSTTKNPSSISKQTCLPLHSRVISTCLWGTFNQFKEVEDALRIRRSIIDCFERASLPSVSEDEKKRILHFVVVGGGPTGVEFAAELHDFLHEDLVKLFDKRITDFAEEKFKRDGINVKTGSMVVKVSDKSISLKERSTGEMKDLPYGMVVWSTGIGTRPVVMDFMKQIGQGNRRVMATDEWLRVEGVPNVYALGDCAMINQRKVMEDISAIFSKADKNKSGKLNVGDFAEVINDIIERYPQVELHLKSKKLKNFVELLQSNQDDAAKKATQLDIEKFKKALSEVDTKMKSLHVAAQQGEYLAKCFNMMKECEENPEGPIRFRDSGRHHFKPFRYKHLGPVCSTRW
ncbi:putative NADH:ubiquinone reductase (non-electrogenic) [Helianthus annuus]|nr:putative NADH:ubiquinone reductase (non-electrogenic) [Helianthus annuus]KAJ0506051.1 putative NADH:ubiquinone reductase (non-electrogenic) [Helianthus annuus]KAJ0675721.1 putative NADH:ubiquinone reductase (non-electrogenic) [Helianthus annuus]KAJ0678990.1 putative NADH:ubiquinone reductase (non-electrogenic) [Helianthus annuus]